MCYSVYLSTNSRQDLKCYNEKLIYFEKIAELDEFTSLLENENKWYVGSSSGCGCTFRHLSALELGFDEPKDWYPEDEESIEATKKLYNIIRKLTEKNYKVDCLDAWYGVKPSEIKTMDFKIRDISRKQFRLFENHLFRIHA